MEGVGGVSEWVGDGQPVGKCPRHLLVICLARLPLHCRRNGDGGASDTAALRVAHRHLKHRQTGRGAEGQRGRQTCTQKHQ